MAKDHFVPRHYLRQFSVNDSEEIMVSKISPYKHLGKKGLGWACQQLDFYEGDEALNKIIWTCENDLAPVLVGVAKREDFTEPELVALRWLAVTLHFRTKKAVEAYALLPKRIFYEFVQNEIERGDIPLPPEGKWTEQMVKCNGVPGFLLRNAVVPCAMELQTLACKLLKAPDRTAFITSDNPVLVLNQFCAAANPLRSYVGFSKSGFQLLMPISPKLCVFFYDAKVYKVGCRRDRVVTISAKDVEIVNSLQLQSAGEFALFHDPTFEFEVAQVIARYSMLRAPIRNCLDSLSNSKTGDELLRFKQLSVNLPDLWNFCRFRRYVNATVGDRRNPGWTALIGELMDDLEKNRNGGDMHVRIERILADPNSLTEIRRR